MSVANNLKNARIAKDLTQEEVGNLLGVAKQTIQKYEKGVVTNIPVERIQALADIYGVSPIELMDWHEEEPKDINEIGDKMAASIVMYFANEQSQILIQRLKDFGLNMTYKGKKVV